MIFWLYLEWFTSTGQIFFFRNPEHVEGCVVDDLSLSPTRFVGQMEGIKLHFMIVEKILCPSDWYVITSTHYFKECPCKKLNSWQTFPDVDVTTTHPVQEKRLFLVILLRVRCWVMSLRLFDLHGYTLVLQYNSELAQQTTRYMRKKGSIYQVGKEKQI